ncbi:MAG: PIN domain-containing protein [Candidatus Binatia bacterium]
MPNGNLALLDTSVYIENFRTGRFTQTLLRSPWIIRCSVVVLHELRRGARTPQELRFVNELASKIRIITPTGNHWLESAEILSRIRRKKGYDSNKLRELAFDVLIALSARDIGATLVTCNREDFAEIRNHTSFRILFW